MYVHKVERGGGDLINELLRKSWGGAACLRRGIQTF